MAVSSVIMKLASSLDFPLANIDSDLENKGGKHIIQALRHPNPVVIRNNTNLFVIPKTYASTNPWAMVVVSLNADSAFGAMETSRRTKNRSSLTNFEFIFFCVFTN
eukprot:CAMPEP_0197006288 /NCGR_PEP_ID=MMETSP1380-20130617/34049_1 /TAXON_ID=5936 /ORGANISM="Euplotes crassus, Strain CT5" /LENGTH=105 /DNA_ID=CAMNT_0042425813 /DNA_START=273 /DNA_END=587 /DNA_ORIENTATION=-